MEDDSTARRCRLHTPVCHAAISSTSACLPCRCALSPQLPSLSRPCRLHITSILPPHSHLSRRCRLHSSMSPAALLPPSTPVCPAAVSSHFRLSVPPLSRIHQLRLCPSCPCRLHPLPSVPPLSSLLPSVPPLSPPFRTRLCPAAVASTPVCPTAVASTPHPSLSRRCRLYSRLPCRCRLDSTPVCPAAVASIHSGPSGLCRLHACNANATSVATAPACPDAVVTTVCLAAAALSPPHRCRLHSRLSRAAVARPPVSCQTDAVSSERRAEERPPGRQAAASQTDAVSASGALRCGRRSAARLMRYRQRAPR